ncbi:MAG TPA: sugar-transfer associated ATP-grasp domain-containing protein [Anaerohalosphaeraceae bacterium]|nr:sugar-transfer associated ATP-grasp domain-containing protein [Anaerohalosphaeraceae bacterium]
MSLLLEHLCRIINSLRLVFGSPEELTYYPESERKSRLRIYLEQTAWMLRHQEISHFYYFYGCDRLNGPSPFHYGSKKKFIRYRDAVNARAQIGTHRINYNCLLQDKFLFGQYVGSLGFPTPRVLGLAGSGGVCLLNPIRQLSWEDFLQTQEGTFFVKDVLGERAQGVFQITVQSGTLFLGQEAVLLETLKPRLSPLNILQESVCQHPLMSEINPASVNTLRLVTVRSGKETIPLAAMVRLGAGKSFCDNLAEGGLAVGVDLADGRMMKWGFFKPGFGKKTERHPQTGFIFEKTRIPFFKEAVDAACRLHRFFYGTHSIGWDIAITEGGPTFLEGNNS